MTFEIFRCRSCYHKPRPGCAMCAYWVDFQERHAERIAVAHQCACGFVSNVPRLVLEHDAGTCAPWLMRTCGVRPKDAQR